MVGVVVAELGKPQLPTSQHRLAASAQTKRLGHRNPVYDHLYMALGVSVRHDLKMPFDRHQLDAWLNGHLALKGSVHFRTG